MGPVEVLWDINRVSSEKDMGLVEVLWDGDEVPYRKDMDQWKYYGMEMGYPWKDLGPVEVLWIADGLPPGCELTNKLKI